MLEVANQIVTIINDSNPIAVISLIAFGAIGVAALALVVVHTAIRQDKRK